MGHGAFGGRQEKTTAGPSTSVAAATSAQDDSISEGSILDAGEDLPGIFGS
jgi:hypothetical protein